MNTYVINVQKAHSARQNPVNHTSTVVVVTETQEQAERMALVARNGISIRGVLVVAPGTYRTIKA